MNTAEKVVEYVKKTLTMTDCKQAFAVPGSDSIVDLVHPVTGRSVHYGNTLEEIRAPILAPSWSSFDAWLQSKAERQHSPIEWTETTEEKYFEMLEVLHRLTWQWRFPRRRTATITTRAMVNRVGRRSDKWAKSSLRPIAP